MGGKGCSRYVEHNFVVIQQRKLIGGLVVWTGLIRLRDTLKSQLQELSRSKPRGKADENIISEIARLESAITLAKDDLVSSVKPVVMHTYKVAH